MEKINGMFTPRTWLLHSFKEQLEFYNILQWKEKLLICLLPSINLRAPAEVIILALIKPLDQRHM